MQTSQQDSKPAENKVSFRMPEELHLRLKLVAVRERKSVQEILVGLAQSYVNAKETRNV